MADMYDPRQVAVIVNGQELVGFADGTFIQGERSNERYGEPHVGAKGEVTFVRNADDTGTITVTLKHNSASNAFLMQLWREQDEDGTELTVSVIDRNFDNDVSVGGSQAKIANLPAFSRGDEVEDVEWVFRVADYDAAFEGAE